MVRARQRTSTATATTTSFLNGSRPVVGDFDGDGKDDIYFCVAGSGYDAIGYGSPRGWLSFCGVPTDDTAVPSVADFDGNGTSDIPWSFPDENDSIWIFSTTRGQKSAVPTSSILGNQNGNALPLAGDYNADGVGDVFGYSR